MLLLLATLAARFVPAMAIDVPDQFLIDLERLAVTAWSARERPHGRRRGMVVPPTAVAHVAARGARIVTASAAGVWVVVAVSRADAAGHRRPAGRPHRRAGAWSGCRGPRCCWPRAAIATRPPGPCCAAPGSPAGPRSPSSCSASSTPPAASPSASPASLLAVVLVVVAVATGRGWRSAWWSRRAEVAEGLAGAGAIAALVVASGLFRALWEIKFRV